MVAHANDSSTSEAEAGLSSKPVWSTQKSQDSEGYIEKLYASTHTNYNKR